MKKIISITFAMVCYVATYCQINLVKNWHFQFGFGEPVCVYCHCGSGSPPTCTNQNIQADIYDWLNAETEDNCNYCNASGKQNCPTADWVDKDSCPNGLEIGGYPLRTASDRFIRLGRKGYKQYQGGVDPSEKFYEGVRSTLNQDVQGWTDYILRVKIAAESSDIGNTRSLRVTFSKYADHWYRKYKNVTLEAAHFTLPANTPHHWYTFEKKFSTSLHNQMKQIIVIRDRGDDGGYLFVDNVELYEYCPNLLPIQKRTFDSTDLYNINFDPLPMEGKMVHSGDSVTSLLPQGEVVCDSLSKINFKGEWEVRLKPGTRIKHGANFRAYISPCGVACPIPSAYVAEDTSLCGNGVDPVSIGGPSEPTIEYTWTSEPAGDIVLLSNPTIANPTFLPPLTGRGTVRFKLKATSPCGSEQTRFVTVTYDNSPSNTPFFVMDSLFSQDSIQFTLKQLDSKTEKIKVQILSCDGLDTLEEYIFNNKIDFNCCDFKYKYNNYLNPCNCYKVRVATKNYCFDTWKDTVFTHTRNSTFDFAILTNAGHRNQDDICFKVKGATHIEFTFVNRWDQPLKQYSVTVDDTVMCFKVPNVPTATYRILGTVKDCGGNDHDFDFLFAVFDRKSNSTKGDFTQKPNVNIDAIGSPENSIGGKELEYVVYPNPANDELHFTYYTINDNTSTNISVFDALGKELLKFESIKTIAGRQEDILDVATLADGVYFLKIQIGNDKKMERLIINRN